MADALKILGQAKPAANALEVLYTVPVGAQCTVTSLFVCNVSGGSSSFTIEVARGGADSAPSQAIHFADTLAANSTFPVAAPIMLASTDVLRVKSNDGNCSFTATGLEMTG